MIRRGVAEPVGRFVAVNVGHHEHRPGGREARRKFHVDAARNRPQIQHGCVMNDTPRGVFDGLRLELIRHEMASVARKVVPLRNERPSRVASDLVMETRNLGCVKVYLRPPELVYAHRERGGLLRHRSPPLRLEVAFHLAALHIRQHPAERHNLAQPLSADARSNVPVLPHVDYRRRLRSVVETPRNQLVAGRDERGSWIGYLHAIVPIFNSVKNRRFEFVGTCRSRIAARPARKKVVPRTSKQIGVSALVDVRHEECRAYGLVGGELHVALRPHGEERDGLLAGKRPVGDLDDLRLDGGVGRHAGMRAAAHVRPRIEFRARRLGERGGVKPEHGVACHEAGRSRRVCRRCAQQRQSDDKDIGFEKPPTLSCKHLQLPFAKDYAGGLFELLARLYHELPSVSIGIAALALI